MSIPRTHSVRSGYAGPAAVSRTGQVVRLRPPRFSDFDEWRRIRLRDRAVIEPYWASSPLPWEARHTEGEWVQECLHLRACRQSSGFAVEVDGRFSGQVNLTGIDVVTRSAEMGIWMDSTWGKRGIGLLAASLLMDHAFTRMGLNRLTAPICVDNIPATRGAERIGFNREATMRASFDAGGRRKDHALYAMTADRVPEHGLAAMWSDPDAVVPEPEPSPHEPLSLGALATTCRFTLGSAKRLAPSRSALRSTHGVVGELILRPARLLHVPLPHRGTASGCVLAGAWQRTSPLAEWSGHALGYSVEARGARVGAVGFELLDLVRHNATLRVESTDEGSHRAILPATVWLLDRAFGLLGMERVHTGVDPGNAAAVALAKALGLSCEGRMSGIGTRDGGLRDLDLWAIVADGIAVRERQEPDRPTRVEG